MKIGLIGAGIARSLSPHLHGFLGRLYGVEIDYHLIDSTEIAGFEFSADLDACAEDGFCGVNVTHPFKTEAHALVRIDDPNVARIGATNTITFCEDGWRGTNTDYTGFISAFSHHFGGALPGKSLIVGAGGVGKAMAFSLAQLGADEIWLYDIDAARSKSLARTLVEAGVNAVVVVSDDLASAVRRADGLINGSPIGMWSCPGIPFPEELIGGQRWAFDAVYTPMETEFLKAAKAKSLDILSGYDLFLFQGFDAFEIFTGIKVDAFEAMASFPGSETKTIEKANP